MMSQTFIRLYLFFFSGEIAQAHVFQFLLLLFEPRSGRSLFLLFKSRQFPQRSAPLLFIMNL